MLQRLLIVWLVLLSLVAFSWPQWFGNVENPDGLFDPFRDSEPYLDALIALTMFSLGWMLPADELRQVARRWPVVLGGTTAQYTTMPLLAWCTARLWGLDADDTIGVILVGCVPGAMASNVLTLNARGNTSYSVSLTTVSTLLSPLAVPAAMWLTLAAAQRSVSGEASFKLLYTVVLPVVAGFATGRLLPNWQNAARRACPIVANLAILWVIAVVVALNRDRLAQASFGLLLPLLSINLLGYLAGYGAARTMRLPDRMRRALTLEVGMQNAGVGTVLALGLFPEQREIAIAPAIYTFGCMLTGTALAAVWSSIPPRSDSVPT